MQSIETINGIFYFNEIPLFYGRKKIDKHTCVSNLLDLKKILDANNVPFGLIFGTLLGAVRENDFITHDEDVDIYVFDEARVKLLSLLNDFIDFGFQIARYNKNLISIIRDNDYIDIYFINKNFFGFSFCDDVYIPKKYLSGFDEIYFLGQFFTVPKYYLDILVLFYGKNWQTPKANFHAQSNSFSFKLNHYSRNFRKILKKILPNFFINFINEKLKK